VKAVLIVLIIVKVEVKLVVARMIMGVRMIKMLMMCMI